MSIVLLVGESLGIFSRRILGVSVFALVVSVASLSSVDPLEAATFTYTASGVIDSASGDVSPVAGGDSFTAIWSVDSTVAAGSGGGTQPVYDALLSLQINIGGGKYTDTDLGSAEIQVDNDPSHLSFPDRYGVVKTSGLATTLNGHTVTLFFLNFTDSTNTVYAGITDASPLPTALDLAAFDGTAFDLFFDDGSSIFGHVTSLRVEGTPIPAALPLFATGLGALGFVGLRRRRKSAVS